MLFLREKFSFKKGVLLCITFFGLLLLLEFNFSISLEESTGNLWSVAAALCYALFIVLNRNIPENIPTLMRTFYQFLFALIVILPFLDSSIFNISLNNLYWLIAIGFFQGFLAITLFTFSMKHLQAVEYGTIAYIEPLVASLIGFVFYAEALSTYQIVGCGIITSVGLLQIIDSRSDK